MHILKKECRYYELLDIGFLFVCLFVLGLKPKVFCLFVLRWSLLPQAGVEFRDAPPHSAGVKACDTVAGSNPGSCLLHAIRVLYC